jgi:hypothetical protein
MTSVSITGAIPFSDLRGPQLGETNVVIMTRPGP